MKLSIIIVLLSLQDIFLAFLQTVWLSTQTSIVSEEDGTVNKKKMLTTENT